MHVSSEPVKNPRLAFRTFQDRLRIVPKTIQAGMTVPESPKHVRRYPDASKWAAAHGMAIQKFEKDGVIYWTGTAPITA